MQARLRPSARRLGALARHVAAQQQPAAGIAYGDYLSTTSAAREPSALRSLYPLLQIEGMLSLGNGQPNPDSFPFASLSVTTKDGETFELEGAELDTAQQYADTVGTASLREWLESYIADEHDPPPLECGRDLIVTVGSQDGASSTTAR